MSLKGVAIPNDSYVDIDDIGLEDNALLCHCCDSNTNNRVGEWYFPSGNPVQTKGSNGNFYRDRDIATVTLRLNRVTNPQERGHFCCEVPEDYNMIVHKICVIIGTCS